MAASFLLSRTANKNTLLSFTSFVFPKLPFSSVCRKSEHFEFSPESLRPPVAKKVPFTETSHGIKRGDPYRWMSNIKDPDFISYINQENSYAEAFMRDTEEMQRVLYSEMVSRMPSNISTPPERWGPWLYYECIPEGREFPVLCRKRQVESRSWLDSVFSSEQVLLDWNQIAEKHGYVHVGTCRVSPDHSFLAYTVDTKGDEQFQLQIKDLRDNSLLTRPRVTGVVSLAWALDGRTLFYTLCDQNQRPNRVLCTKLGSHSDDDAVIFAEDDTRFCLDITSTKDGKFVTVNSNSRTSSEVYIINAVNPQDGLKQFCKRVSGVQYFLEHHCGLFYVLTNASTSKYEFSGDGYYLARCRVEDANSSNLKDIIVAGVDNCFEDMDIFNGQLVLFVNRNGSPSICSIDIPVDINNKKATQIEDLNPWYFPVPFDTCTVAPGSNHDFMSTVFRAVLSSPVTPDLIIDYNMSSRTFLIVQQEDVNVDNETVTDFSQKYAVEEKEVISYDGVKIPLTTVYSRLAYQKGQSPGLLHGYGAYGESLDKVWCSDRLSLLDRGWIFAFADVRGGAGVDPSWHRSGRGLNKLSSIHDFVSCGEYLINEGIVGENQLSAIGMSAGCLLVGAAINMHPQLFSAAIFKVPFLDVLTTLSNPSLPLTTLDYEEFGNPEDESCFEYILKYSPYDNVAEGVCCPLMLVSASFNDSRVGVWEAAKWVAKIRDKTCSRCSSAVILQTNMSGGHFREGGRFGHCWETAYDYAFLMKALRIQSPQF